MNLRFVLLVVGGALLIEAFFLLICSGYTAFFEPQNTGMQSAWMKSFGLCSLSALLCILIGFKSRKDEIFHREAFAVVGVGWIICSFLGSFPFYFSPYDIPFWDSLFESVSGLTTTGATIFTDLEKLPRSLHLWRSLTQWIGGMGIVVLFVALLGFIGAGHKAIFANETSSLAETGLRPRVRSLTLRYLSIYLGLTIVAFAGLLLCGPSFFDSFTHATCAVSTAGFSPYNDSIAHFPQWYVHLWLIIVMILGGIAFPVHFQFFILKQYNHALKNEELRCYFWIIGIATSIICFDLLFVRFYEWDNFPRAALDSLFQVVAVMTTTGFSTVDFALWPGLSKMLLIILMIIGGCAGSTSGGIKVSRIILFAKAALRYLQLSFLPRTVKRLRLNGTPVEEAAIQGVAFYFAIYFVVLLIGVLTLSILEPNLDLTTVHSSVLACFNNLGPALDKAGPSENYAFFNPASKIWLSILMLVGRLEMKVILVLLIPAFWKKF